MGVLANLLALAAITVVLVELVRALPLAGLAARLAAATRGPLRTMGRAGVSDHWKERAMLILARRTFLASAGCLLCLAAFGGVAALLLLAAGSVLPGLAGLAFSWAGLAVSAAVATLYVVLRSRGPRV